MGDKTKENSLNINKHFDGCFTRIHFFIRNIPSYFIKVFKWPLVVQ